jgi:predicted polyphosphate/ATP-dependent NAD kinase
MRQIGFLINPIAGMGGPVGLKGTDNVVEEARRLGAEPSAAEKARRALTKLKSLCDDAAITDDLAWLTCASSMGAEVLEEAGFCNPRIVYTPGHPTCAADTKAAVKAFLNEALALILFCGGDGTARDICSVVGEKLPILGIPAGVKMYSGVFGASPLITAEILFDYLQGRLELAEAEVLDLDEERYRGDQWAVRLHYAALTPFEPSRSPLSKMLVFEASDAEVQGEIARHLVEEIKSNPQTLYLLGPGTTVKAVAATLGLEKTLLGIDAVVGEHAVRHDLNEQKIAALMAQYSHCKVILSPIGAQGFILGRGNQPLTPDLLRRIGRENIIVMATPAKLARTAVLRFDTGDPDLDGIFAGNGFFPVLIGYHERRMVRVHA